MKIYTIILCVITFLCLSFSAYAKSPIPDQAEENGSIDDHKPMDPSPNFKLEIVGFGCAIGFGGWVTPAKDSKTEFACDMDNLRKFQALLGECQSKPIDQLSEIAMFDMDKDGCVKCQDYLTWKESLKKLFDKGDRTTSAEDVFFSQCDNEKIVPPTPALTEPLRKIDKVYNSDGSVYSETDLFSDRNNGFYKTFYPNGQLHTEVRYKNNNEIYDKAFDENGKPIFRNGIVKTYYSGGIVASEGNYRNDLKQGKHVYYYYDGKTVVDIWHFMNGRRVDFHIRNDASGNFVSKEDFGYPTNYVRRLQYIILGLSGLLILCFGYLYFRRNH